MPEPGLAAPYRITVLIWLAKVVLLALVSVVLAWLGIRVLDAFSPHIHKRQRIGEGELTNPGNLPYLPTTDYNMID